MVMPSPKWFPTSQPERALWLNNFNNALIPVAASLGITPGEMASLALDVEDYQSLAATTLAADTFKSALREYRLSLTEGRVGDPQPVFPSESFNAPPNNRPAGLFQRIVELIDRIRAAPAYTDEIGAALGIIPKSNGVVPPASVKPTIQTSASQTGYLFSIIVANRADADAWTVMVQPKGGAWTNAGTFTGKSADVTFNPGTPGEPVMISVRVQLKRKNENYGQLSDIVPMTLNP